MDRIDFDILERLQNNARLSNKELAAAVGLAPSSCLERVRRLEREGVLRGSHAEVDPQAVGIGLQAMIQVRLEHHSRREVEGFRNHVLSLEAVLAFYHLTGAFDFMVLVAVQDADALRDLALDAFTTRKEVAQIQTSLVFESRRAPVLPVYA